MALNFLNNGYFAGKVGIGTESPAARLHINPTTTNEIAIAINGTQSYSAGQFQRIAAGDANSIDRLSIGFGYDDPTDWAIRYSSYGRHEFYTGNDWGNAANTEKMVITSSGNVGIGVTSPSGALHVKSSTATTTGMVRLQNDMDNNYETLRVESLGNYDAHIGFLANGTSDYWWGIGIDYSDSGKFKISGDNILSVNTRLTIDTSGNVGIGTTSPTNYKLEVNGTVKGDSFGTNESTTARIFAPSGAAYNGGGSQTGYLIMELPDNAGAGINNMMSGVIRVFDYTYGESFDVHFAGYWYSGYNWTNCTAFVISEAGVERNFPVRFGASTGASGSEDRPYIAIGDTASVWTYCKFSVTEYTSGHSNAALHKWNSGWAASLSSTLPGSVLVTVSNTQTNNWKRTGYDLYYSNGGNVGIGITNPSSYDSNADNLVIGSIGANDKNGITIVGGDTDGRGAIYFADTTQNSAGYITYKHADNSMLFGTSDATRIVIDSAGAIKFNTYGAGTLVTDASGNITVSSGGGAGGPYLPLAGGTMTGTNGVVFPDAFKLNLGTGSDLQIYHDSANSYIETSASSAGDLYIKAQGTNHDLYLQAVDDILIRPQGGENGIKVHGNDSVELYFNNARRLRTTTGGVFVEGEIKIDSALLDLQENTDVDTGTEIVASVAIANYTAAFFDFVIKKTTNVRSGTVYACHDGTNVEFTETSTQDLGDTSDVTLSVDISGTNMRLQATTTSDDWSIKSLIRAI